MSNTPNCGAEDTIGCVCGYCEKFQVNKTIGEILAAIEGITPRQYYGKEDVLPLAKYDYSKNEYNIFAEQQIEALITKARIDELESLVETTKCLRADCRTSHKVKRSSIDERIAELMGGK